MKQQITFASSKEKRDGFGHPFFYNMVREKIVLLQP